MFDRRNRKDYSLARPAKLVSLVHRRTDRRLSNDHHHVCLRNQDEGRVDDRVDQYGDSFGFGNVHVANGDGGRHVDAVGDGHNDAERHPDCVDGHDADSDRVDAHNDRRAFVGRHRHYHAVERVTDHYPRTLHVRALSP